MKSIQETLQVIAYQMRTLRINHHMTQKQMGKVLNVSAQTVSAYENGAIRPDIEVIMKYANYFNVDVTNIISISSAEHTSEVFPTQSEVQMFMAYRRRPAWMKKVIRELCFNGTEYRTAEEETEYASMLNEHEDKYHKE
ncbi:MAG: helix-turn-helix domain-containing protein [Erysipelotrichaceae bacterium]|nr:helix-turn-helix domain-containing protein [Erysipelotrichaceae bacterium]